jgi:heme-degrading monooxygenase HmoA
MLIQFIRLKSKLPEEELMRRAREREPRFKALEGLVQKYYVKLEDPGAYAGIYVWESKDSLDKFRKSDLAASIPAAYEVIEVPNIETFEMIFQLRE